MQGWIKLHRQFTEWEWYTDDKCFRLFIHLLLKCNHKPAKWRGETIERGETITSLSGLAGEVGMSIQTLRTTLLKLEKTGEINKQSTSKLTKITICNYATYQESEDAANKQTNKPLTNDQQTTNKPLTTNKNDNNNNNEIIITNHNEKCAVVISHWNKTFSTSTKVDKALENELNRKINEYGMQEVKRVITDFHKYYNGSEYWIDTPQTMFSFTKGEMFGKVFHATEESMRSRAKTGGKISNNGLTDEQNATYNKLF